MRSSHEYEPIEDYGIIGNLHTVALISKKGSVNFMCYPRFDSPTIFAALLDKEKGGHFCITPNLSNVSYKQLYLPDTAILLTRFLSDDGIAEITDFMPVDNCHIFNALVRKVTTIRGHIKYNMDCAPAFNYGQSPNRSELSGNKIIFTTDNSSMHLSASVSLHVLNNSATASFELSENETAFFIFESADSNKRHKIAINEQVCRWYHRTISFWQEWIENSAYKGRWLETVNRSAITLKLLTSLKYGSLVAAATFGLPEAIGGQRNWDYRYTWIRDASFTMYIFLKLGFRKEASSFLSWIQKRCKEGELQLMYAVDGTARLDEENIDGWEGYKGSKPVRIGNQAHMQFQLDVFGELMDTIYLFNKDGGSVTYEFWKQIQQQIQVVLKRWQEPDHGIWEVRSQKRHFLYSRLMCWVTIDRAIKIAESRSFPYPHADWHEVRDEIFESIYTDFWNDRVQAFVQHKGATAIDASALMLPLRRFISPHEDKWQKTMDAIDKELRTDVLIYRYNNDLNNIDGLVSKEGTFSMCSFWYVECLAKAGKVEQARESFEKMLGYTNHLGLFAEEIGLRGQQLGNYPQAFTHLALISAALELNKQIERKKASEVKTK
jgi:GH15 family glucan-1,4-alpha-glucosidase